MTVSEEHLFRGYSRDEVSGWAKRLRYFRFCRGPGGHANEPDQLLVVFRSETSAAVAELLGKLGLPPDATGRRELFGTQVFIYHNSYLRQLQLSPSSYGKDPFAISAEAVDAAALVEPHLAALAELIIDPPIDSALCICPKYYPEIWAT